VATVAQHITESSGPSVSFWEFLKEELAPYPGRAALVARMVISATIAMILTMTFRIPYGFEGALFTLLISRESPRATIQTVRTLVTFFSAAAIYTLIGATFSLGDPMVRLLWIIGTLFILFYAISVITQYIAALAFAILITATIPLWDTHIPAELKVERTLWALLQTVMGCAITLAVELVFAGLKRGDDLVRLIAQRLATVEELINCYIADRPVEERTKKEITRLATVGTSRLRRMLKRSAGSQSYSEQMGAVVALVARLVDIAANQVYISPQISDNDRKRMRGLVEGIASIRTAMTNGRIPSPIEFPGEGETSNVVPLLRETERTVSLIPEALAGSQTQKAYAAPPLGDPPSRLFAADALSNSEHLKFALRGCLAASLCYIIYTSIAWPGINAAILTCLFTALSTIGLSRHKQVLLIGGTVAGGLVLGMGAQVFVLPYIDSIIGFTLLFIAVTFLAAWFATSSPRLSYLGIQLALGFFIINLQEFKILTSLTAARDRIVGVLLGLTMMWLVFDQLWGAPAVVEMKKAFISSLRLLAKLAREPSSKDLRVSLERTYSLRESINTGLENVRASTDAVLFEFGPSRQQDLALRSQIRNWQTQLRVLFVTQTTWVKYSLQLPGFELPQAIRVAQQEFDDGLARMLEGMADRIEGKASTEKEKFEDLFERLEQEIRACCSDQPQEELASKLQTFLTLFCRIEGLALSLDKEI